MFAGRAGGDIALVLGVLSRSPAFCFRVCDAADLGGWGDRYRCPTNLSPLSSRPRCGISHEELGERVYLHFLSFVSSLGCYIHLLGCKRYLRSVPWVERS